MNRKILRMNAFFLTLLMLLCIPFQLFPCASAMQSPPDISAEAYVLMDARTGMVICGKNETEKRPMASTTKIMTVLLTLESGGLDDEFVVDADAIHVEGSSMGLQEGDVVTKRALCVGMLLPSGNDAANAAAVAVGGDIPHFLEMMNQRAAEIGMTRTCFASPSGLDADGHGASAQDMGLLAREALKNPEFAAICSQPSMTLKFGNPPYERTLYNTNKLLTMAEGVIGVKTGYTDAAGRCLVSACEREGRRLICVTLYDRNDWADHMALYDYGFADVKEMTADVPKNLGIALEGGTEEWAAVYAQEGMKLNVWHGKAADVTMRVSLPPFRTMPLEAGQAIGELVYEYEGREVWRTPLRVRF